MRQILIPTALSALLGLAACESIPVDLATAPAVPLERVVDKAALQPGAERVTVLLSYESVPGPQPGVQRVYVDGNHVGTLHVGEKFEFFVDPGRRVLQVQAGRLSNPKDSLTEIFDRAYGTYKYRITAHDSTGRLEPDLRK